MPDRRRATRGRQASYDDAGIDGAARLVQLVAGEDAAALFAFLSRLRRTAPQHETIRAAEVEALSHDPVEGTHRLLAANNAFAHAFGLRMLSHQHSDDAEPECPAHRHALARDFWALLGSAPAAPPALTAMLDRTGKTWVEIVLAAARAGGGHQFAMRCLKDDARSSADFAAHVAAAGLQTIQLKGDEPILAALLRAELVGGGRAVVVVDGGKLVQEGGTSNDPDGCEDVTSIDTKLAPHWEIASALHWFGQLTNVYVWCVPRCGILPPAVRRLIGACFGPLGHDPDWRVAHVRSLAPGIGASGIRALSAAVDDARDTAAMAALAVALAREGGPDCSDVDAACRLIGRAFNATPLDVETELDAKFDLGLLACDGDGARLLAQGHELARGARVLAFGAPGTGKSAYARVLAGRIAEASGGMPPIFIEPAALLAKSWGETEQRVAALWQRAHRSNTVLIADEFDSMAAVREPVAPASGNAYLIRCLTNEFLRQMDAYPKVPLIATVNEIEALDAAVRRRFAIAIKMRDWLSPAQERRAWTSVLGVAAPKGWTASGATISDFTAALERCRLTGSRDRKSYATAIVEARTTRLGSRETAASGRKGRLH